MAKQIGVEKGEKVLIRVSKGEDPYSVIGSYIRDHIKCIEDMIAVIEINGAITNELFMVDMNEYNYFVWKSDWYEGEDNVGLVDFFPVSEAVSPRLSDSSEISIRDIDDKIEAVVKRILNTDISSITLEQFNVLKAEQRDYRSRAEREKSVSVRTKKTISLRAGLPRIKHSKGRNSRILITT